MNNLLCYGVCICLIISCNSAEPPTEKDIYPISPYRSILDFKDDLGNFSSRAIIDYYVIYGDLSDTVYMRNFLIDYASHHFDRSIFKGPTNYEIEFYKKSKTTHKEFKEKDHDLIDYHTADDYATVTINDDNKHEIVFHKK